MNFIIIGTMYDKTYIMKQKMNQTLRIMKTIKKTLGKSKKLIAVFVVFVMMILTSYGQLSVHNLQFNKILLSVENMNSSAVLSSNEESVSLENWMTDYKNWKVNKTDESNIFSVDNENALQVESWMLEKFNTNKFDNSLFSDPVKDNTVEDWMLNPNDWGNSK